MNKGGFAICFNKPIVTVLCQQRKIAQNFCIPGDTSLAELSSSNCSMIIKLLGTLCDISSITDEKGNNLLQEYKISTERDAALLTYEFTIYLASKNEIQGVNIDFVFGVNEDLSSRFSMSDRLLLSLSLLE
ncbi:MAG: hypothetical protein RR696_01445 [Clostridia bacterium]